MHVNKPISFQVSMHSSYQYPSMEHTPYQSKIVLYFAPKKFPHNHFQGYSSLLLRIFSFPFFVFPFLISLFYQFAFSINPHILFKIFIFRGRIKKYLYFLFLSFIVFSQDIFKYFFWTTIRFIIWRIFFNLYCFFKGLI